MILTTLMKNQDSDHLCVLVSQLCLTLCDPMDCSPPDSYVHGILQQEYWSGLPFLSPGNLPDPGIEPGSPALQADSLPFSHEGSPCHILDSTYIIWYIFHMISYGGWLSLSDLPSLSMIISSCVHVVAIVLFYGFIYWWISLSIHMLMDIWIIIMFWLLWIVINS